MLLGTVLGVIIMLLVFACLFLKGQNMAFSGQLLGMSRARVEADQKVVALEAALNRREQLPFVINFTEDQCTDMASRVCARVQTMMQSQNEAALRKLN